MKKEKYLLIFVLTVFVVSFSSIYSPSFAVDDNITLEFIAAGIEHNASLVKDITLDFQKKCLPGKHGIYCGHDGKWIRKGDMLYLEARDKATNIQRVESYIRGKTISWSRDLDKPKDSGYGIIVEGENYQVFRDFSPPPEFTVGYKGSKWIWLFRNGTAELIGTGDIDGHLCHIVSGKFAPEGGMQYKVWVDTGRRFQPLKIEIIHPDKGVIAWWDSFKLQEFKGGIWLSTEVIWSGEEVTTATNISINQGVSDEQFIIEWAEGTRVRDEIQDISVIIGRDVPARELLEEVGVIVPEEEEELKKAEETK